MNAIQQLAKDVLAQVQETDDIDIAKQLAREAINGDPQLLEAAIAYAVDSIIGNEWRAGRSARWRAQQVPVVDVIEPAFGGGVRTVSPVGAALRLSLERAVAEAKQRLMEWELEPGRRLCDATRADLLRFAERNEKQANTEMRRAHWYRGVAEMLPDGKARVKDVLREADLQRAKRKAEAE